MISIHYFDQNVYIRRNGGLITLILLVSLLIDAFLIWNLTSGIPQIVVENLLSLSIWKFALIFLLVINTLLLKVWIINVFIINLKKKKTSHVEISSNEISIYEEVSKISSNRIRFLRGYTMDNNKKNYEYKLVYRVRKVDDVSFSSSGKLCIKGKILVDCLDEYVGLELGTEDHSLKQIDQYSIVPFYTEMKKIELKLLEMKNRA